MRGQAGPARELWLIAHDLDRSANEATLRFQHATRVGLINPAVKPLPPFTTAVVDSPPADAYSLRMRQSPKQRRRAAIDRRLKQPRPFRPRRLWWLYDLTARWGSTRIHRPTMTLRAIRLILEDEIAACGPPDAVVVTKHRPYDPFPGQVILCRLNPAAAEIRATERAFIHGA